jgi:hypothetical protein
MAKFNKGFFYRKGKKNTKALYAMRITEVTELIALHRCLLEAKFSASPTDYDIAGSPIAAKLANQTLEHLVAIDGQKWTEWRKFENHTDRIQSLVTSLKRKSLSHILDDTMRTDFIKNALAPISATQSQIDTVKVEVFENGK